MPLASECPTWRETATGGHPNDGAAARIGELLESVFGVCFGGLFRNVLGAQGLDLVKFKCLLLVHDSGRELLHRLGRVGKNERPPVWNGPQHDGWPECSSIRHRR